MASRVIIKRKMGKGTVECHEEDKLNPVSPLLSVFVGCANNSACQICLLFLPAIIVCDINRWARDYFRGSWSLFI